MFHHSLGRKHLLPFSSRTIAWDNIDSIYIKRFLGFKHIFIKPKSDDKSLKILYCIDNMKGFLDSIEHFGGKELGDMFKGLLITKIK